MAQTIDQFISSGNFDIGVVDLKSKIAPVTQNGRSVLITLAKTPTLTTPFCPWPSYDGGDRTNLDLRITPDLERLAAHIDECVQQKVLANPSHYYSKIPKNLDSLFNSIRREANKEGFSDLLRTKCSFREKSASFRAFDLEAKKQLTINELKNIDWPNSELAIVVKLSGVYFQPSGYGAVISLQTVGMKTASADCPFDFIE